MSKVNLGFLDYEGVTGSTGFDVDDFTAANFTALNVQIDALVAAIADVTLMPLSSDQRVAVANSFPVPLPTDPNAQRGIKWLVRSRDPNGNIKVFRIPGADLSLLATNSKNMDLALPEAVALVAAIEATVRTNDGEPVIVQEIVYLD